MSDEKKFPEKFKKLLPPTFEDSVETMDDTEMESVIIKCEQVISTTETELDEEPTINGAKDLIKEKSGPYKDLINAQKAKIKYVLFVMQQRGKF